MTDKKPVQELEYLPIGEGNKYWSSHDLGCAAALIVIGFDLVSLDKGNPQKVRFVFKGGKGIESIIKNYWDCELEIDAQTYFNALKRLKNQIYSE